MNDADECVAAENCEMNLCEEYPDVCGDYGTCVGTDATYSCECEIGYEFDGFECFDIDECLTGSCLDVDQDRIFELSILSTISCERRQ